MKRRVTGWAGHRPANRKRAEGGRLASGDTTPLGRLPLSRRWRLRRPTRSTALGPVLGPAAEAIARKVQAPRRSPPSRCWRPPLVAQVHADVMMPYGQTRPLSLYIATVAGSGDRKSSADNEALWPIRKYERTLKEIYERDIQVWGVDLAAWKAEKKRIEAKTKIDIDERRRQLQNLGPEPGPPLIPFLTVPDPTVEGLAKAWVSRSSLARRLHRRRRQFVGGHGMSPTSASRPRPPTRSIWDGQPIKRVRASDGVTILNGRRLSMHLMIQPDAAIVPVRSASARPGPVVPHACRGARQHRRQPACIGSRVVGEDEPHPCLRSPPAFHPRSLMAIGSRQGQRAGAPVLAMTARLGRCGGRSTTTSSDRAAPAAILPAYGTSPPKLPSTPPASPAS